MLNMGSKWAPSTFCALEITERFLWKNTFLIHFLTYFCSQNSPFSRHFVTLECPNWLAMGSKRACNGLKKGSFHLFRHRKWSRINLGTARF